MKIISANRSDVFDEYVNIISRYNDKNLIKEGTYLASGRGAFQGADKLAGKGAAELAAEVAAGSARASSIAAERFARAGVTGADQIKKIFSLAEELLVTDKFLIEEGGRLRKATPDELEAITEWAARSPGQNVPGNLMPFNRGISNASSAFKGVRNVTEKNAVDLAKQLETGSKFTIEEAREFRKITSELIGDPPTVRPTSPGAPTDVPPVRPPDGTPGRISDGTPGRISDIERVRRSVARGIVENRATRKAIMESIEELGSSLTVAIREGNEALAERLTRQIDESFQRFDDLLKSEVSALKQANEEMLAAAESRLADAIRSGKQESIDEARRLISELESNLTGQMTSIKNSTDTINSTLRANAEASAQASTELSSKLAAQADQLTEMKRAIDELKGQLENLRSSTSAARGAVDGAATATTAAVKGGKLASASRYLMTALKIAAGVGAGYLIYKWYTGLGGGEDDDGSGGGGRRTGTGDGTDTTRGDETPSSTGFTGEGTTVDPAVKAALDNPATRRDLFDRLDRMDPQQRERLLAQMVEYYKAITYIRLQRPVVVRNELITYVFPSRRRAGRMDSTRLGATEEYFSDVYLNPGNKDYALLISRLRDESGENDAQKIANHAFSAMASGGMFAGFFNRGERYGKGKPIKSDSRKGLAGGGERRLTRKERQIARQQALQESVVSEADDPFSDNVEDYLYDDMDDSMNDPMDAFASGEREYFEKKSKNINISTNKTNSYEFAKKADKISNRYFKDAVEDLQDDEFMKAYYAGFSKLHNQKPKKQKPDYEKLYDLHDETGAELIHKAHPKAISVAEAIGNGGLVENESEKSKAMEEVAFRVPSGNYRARYAFIQNALKKKS